MPPSKLPKQIGLKIRRRRFVKGYSLNTAGHLAHLDKGSLSRIENGADLRMSTLVRIARALDVSLSKLLAD